MQSVLQSSEQYVLGKIVGNYTGFRKSRFSQTHRLQSTDADLGGWPWTDLCPTGKMYSGGN